MQWYLGGSPLRSVWPCTPIYLLIARMLDEVLLEVEKSPSNKFLSIEALPDLLCASTLSRDGTLEENSKV